MDSIFSASAQQKFGREIKPKEFAKKRAEVTPKLDEEEQAREDQRAARKLEKKAKRKVKPRKDEGETAAEDKPQEKKEVTAKTAAEDKPKEEKEVAAKSAAKSASKPAEKAKAAASPSSSSKKNESAPQAQSAAAKKSKDKGKESKNSRKEEEGPKPAPPLPPAGNGKDARTVFMGNVPISETEKSLMKFCSEFGEVESVRLRSLPVAGTAVDESGNQDLVRRVCAIKKKFGTQKGSLNAYVVFKSTDAVPKALAANNRIIGKGKGKGKGDDEGKGKEEKGRHLRVDLVQATLFDPSITVFVGGIPLYCDEEELREHFAEALPRGQGDINSVRIVRDPETQLGKGFAYVLLSDKDAVMAALGLHQKKYRKRWELRVTVCGKRTKRVQKNESGAGASASAGAGGSKSDKKRKASEASDDEEGDQKAGGEKKARWRDLSEEDLAARKAQAAGAVNQAAAAKRISKGSSKVQKHTKNTRHSVLAGKGQTKAKSEKGRKGKRLGGNVKKAMKVAASAAKKGP